MKKFIIMFLLLFITGCDITEIDENLFVISMGMDYDKETDEIEVTLYFIPSTSISKKELVSSAKDKVATATQKGKNETEIIRKIETTHNQAFQFTHISSYIITTRYLEHIGLTTIIDDIINNPRRYPNFYLFTTENKIKEVYEHKNIDNISTYYSILFNPTQVYEQHTEIRVKRISDIISEYYEETLVPTVPLIRVDDSTWSEEDEKLKTIELNGYCYKTDSLTCMNIYDNPGIKFTKTSVLFIQTFEEFNIKIKKLRYVFKYKNGVLNITYFMDANPVSNPKHYSDKHIGDFLSSFIKEEVNKILYTKEDPLRINDYKYRYSIKDINTINIYTDIRFT